MFNSIMFKAKRFINEFQMQNKSIKELVKQVLDNTTLEHNHVSVESKDVLRMMKEYIVELQKNEVPNSEEIVICLVGAIVWVLTFEDYKKNIFVSLDDRKKCQGGNRRYPDKTFDELEKEFIKKTSNGKNEVNEFDGLAFVKSLGKKVLAQEIPLNDLIINRGVATPFDKQAYVIFPELAKYAKTLNAVVGYYQSNIGKRNNLNLVSAHLRGGLFGIFSKMNPLKNIPLDVCEEMTKYLSYKDIHNIILTCKTAAKYSVIEKNKILIEDKNEGNSSSKEKSLKIG